MKDVYYHVSWGTLRLEDLYEAFLEALEDLDPERAAEFPETPPKDPEELAYLVHEDLYDALADCAPIVAEHLGVDPERVVFGCHPGDGSDFAFWVLDEDEDPGDWW